MNEQLTRQNNYFPLPVLTISSLNFNRYLFVTTIIILQIMIL